jgi:hypothetical protein
MHRYLTRRDNLLGFQAPRWEPFPVLKVFK